MIFSAIICTYNPNRQLLKKVINALLSQDFPREDFEIILVDNNSGEAVADADQIKNDPTIIYCHEKRQGLAFARITGVKMARSEEIIFVDDDNVLEPDYLKNLKELINTHKEVAVWGPGSITVNYNDGAPAWIKKNYSSMFQEKNKTRTEYGCVAGWPDYYPAGSGMAVSRKVLLRYIQQFESGQLNATGRKGDSLSSAEDSQIVWTAVKMGLAAGTSPSLKLEHVIPKNRVNRKYLADLNFGIGSSYKAALYETFPELKNSIRERTVIQKLNFFLKMFLKSKGNPIAFYRSYTIENGWFRGLENKHRDAI